MLRHIVWYIYRKFVGTQGLIFSRINTLVSLLSVDDESSPSVTV